MSTENAPAGVKRLTAVDIAGRKGGEKIVALTCYHARIAAIVDPYCDFLLVGDSLAMTLHGIETTIPVTVDMMILHGRAVMRGARRALVVVDMPFGSYEESREQAFRNAATILKETGAGAVKIEGGAHLAETVAFLVRRGIPVMGHVGLTPQAVNTMGGFRVQGKSDEGQELLFADARAISEAGAFAMVTEGIVEPVARELTKAIPTPTIGIGASPECDGQILVLDDMLGLNDWTPKFVKKFGALRSHIDAAAAAYAAEVKDGSFPGRAQLYGSGKPAR